MAHRLEIETTVNDTKSLVLLKKLKSLGFLISKVKALEVYIINKKLNKEQLLKVAKMLSNPIPNL
jgi:hypothetical protein